MITFQPVDVCCKHKAIGRSYLRVKNEHVDNKAPGAIKDIEANFNQVAAKRVKSANGKKKTAEKECDDLQRLLVAFRTSGTKQCKKNKKRNVFLLEEERRQAFVERRINID